MPLLNTKHVVRKDKFYVVAKGRTLTIHAKNIICCIGEDGKLDIDEQHVIAIEGENIYCIRISEIVGWHIRLTRSKVANVKLPSRMGA